MPRARKVCSKPNCPHLRPCPVEGHEPRAWEGSTRRERIGLSGSAQQKRNRWTLEQHGFVCHVCGLFGANEVDHVIPLSQGGTDDEDNRRPIHGRGSGLSCHQEKTAREAAAARRGE